MTNRALSRRKLLRSMAAGLAGAGLGPWTRVGYAADGISVSQITDELAMLSSADCNVLVLTTREGLVLVDSGPAAVSAAVIATLDELPGDQVTALFNTHWHLDQVGSNTALGASGATIFAHEKNAPAAGDRLLPSGSGRIHALTACSRPADRDLLRQRLDADRGGAASIMAI